MHARTSHKALIIVPSLAWLSMAFAAWWIVVQSRRFGPRVPWSYDLFGQPLAWQNNTPLALVTPIAVGAAAVAMIALCNWLVGRAPHPPLVQRTLSVAEVIVTVLAIETALLPAIGTRPVILTACFGIFLALIAIAHADLAGEKVHREEVREMLHLELARGEASRDPRHWHGRIIYVNHDDDALIVRKRSGYGYTLNLAQPGAWALIAAAVLLPFVIAQLFGR